MAKCIFCGAEESLTKEHIFGEWLKDEFPSDAKTTHIVGKMDWPKHVITREPITKDEKRTGNTRSRYAKVVCKSCNNGWMSQLEAAAKPIVLGLMNRSFRALGPKEQCAIATWATKVCMIAEWIKSDKIHVTQEERDTLKNTRNPPKGWGLWIANYAGGSWAHLTVFQHRGNLFSPVVPQAGGKMHYGQSTIFGMKKVIFLVISSNFPGLVEQVGSRINGAPSIAQIWPQAHAKSILWPPELALDDNGVKYLANILSSPRILNQRFNKGANWTFTP